MTGPANRSAGGPFDLSLAVDPGTPAWPGESPFSCGWSWSVARGDSVNVSTVTTSPHVGTHADAPHHVETTWPATESLPLAPFSGPALVVDVAGRSGPLTLDDLGIAASAAARRRLLVRTGISVAGGTFPDRWPSLAEEAVVALLDAGLELLGVDAPSVDARDSHTLAVHRLLFARGAFILENLDLRGVPVGEYHLDALPVRWAGLDAVPVRAVLQSRRDS